MQYKAIKLVKRPALEITPDVFEVVTLETPELDDGQLEGRIEPGVLHHLAGEELLARRRVGGCREGALEPADAFGGIEILNVTAVPGRDDDVLEAVEVDI